jgi:hypothetical protein
MNEQKSFLTYVGEMIDKYRSDRCAALAENATPQPANCLRRFLRWLTSNGGTLLLVAALILTQNVWARQTASPAAPGPSATTVNYQGRLADSGGAPLDGAYGMSFSLWDAATDGSIVWGPENQTAVPVSEGLFSVGLGSQTSGGIPTTVWDGDRYLEITVSGETLSPRELIRSVPIAGIALTVPDGAITSRMARLTTGRVAATENLDLTNSLQPIPGATLEIEVPVASTVFLVASVDFELGPGATALAELHVDGIPVLAGAYPLRVVGGSVAGTSDTWRGTATNHCVFPLSPGTHTLELKARRVLVGGSGWTVHYPHTGFSYIVFADSP